jgi:hypothetical protein
VIIDLPRIATLAQFLFQWSHLPFKVFEAVDRVAEGAGLKRLQEGAGTRESAAKYTLLMPSKS